MGWSNVFAAGRRVFVRLTISCCAGERSWSFTGVLKSDLAVLSLEDSLVLVVPEIDPPGRVVYSTVEKGVSFYVTGEINKTFNILSFWVMQLE